MLCKPDDERLKIDHERFRSIAQRRVAEILETTPESWRKRYWFVLCYESIDAFAARFPDVVAREEGLRVFEVECQAIDWLYENQNKVTDDIDMRKIGPPGTFYIEGEN